MKRFLILIPLMFLISCSSFQVLKREVQNIDDAVVERVMAKIEEILLEKAEEAEKAVIEEVRGNKDMVNKVDNKFIKKSYERLEPILDKAYEDIEPIVRRAAREIQAQVREEILEELTGEEINEACPDCDKKKETEIELKPTSSTEAKIVSGPADVKTAEPKEEAEEKPVEEKPEVQPAPDKTVPDDAAQTVTEPDKAEVGSVSEVKE